MKAKWLIPLFPLMALLFGCGSLTASPVPAELRGNWQIITAEVAGWYPGDIPTRDAMGSLGMFLYFYPDGRYQFDVRLLMNYYSNYCHYNSHIQETGTVVIEGSDFTFRPNPATKSVSDTCGKTSVTKVQGNPATLNITLTQDNAGWPYLRMRWPNGDERFLEKCRTCK